MKRRGRPRHPEILTPREWEVHSLLREGLSNEEIAARLGITVAGAKYHVSEIITKLGVSNRVEAALWTGNRRRDIAGVLALRLRRSAALQVGAGAVVAVVLVAVALFVWGVARTKPDDALLRSDARIWITRDSPSDRPSVMLFDLNRREARRVDLGRSISLVQWVDNEDTLVGYDALDKDYKALRLDGAVISSVLAQPQDGTLNAWIRPQYDGRHVLVYGENRELLVADATTGDEQPLKLLDGVATDGQYARDGFTLAYHTFKESFISQENQPQEDDVNRLVLGDGVVFAEVYGDDVALELAPDAWSPDAKKILMVQSSLGGVCGPNCREFAGTKEYRVFRIGTGINSFIWTSKGTLIIDAVWAGPDRLYVTKYDVTADDTMWAPAFIDLATGKETPAAGILAACCSQSFSFSPDGRYAVTRVGTSGPVTCSSPDACDAPDWDLGCALIDTATGSEVVRVDGTEADIGTAFCDIVGWTPDGTKAIASAGGN